MKNYIIAAFAFATLVTGSITFTACEDIESVKELNLDRVLSSTSISAFVRNKVNIEVSWNAMNKAESYVIEVFKEDPTFAGAPVLTFETATTTYTVTGLEGETSYSIRVKGVAEGIGDSKWVSITRSTEAENIFNVINNEDIEAHAVTLSWDATNTTVTRIVISANNKNDITYNLTSTDIANKKARIDQLDESTSYTAKLYNVSKLRGTVTFKTGIDFAGKTPVYEGDDLVEKLNAAADGAVVVIVSGSFELGDYIVTKSITISGYDKTNMPTIYGRLKPASGASSIEVSNLIFRGDSPLSTIVTANFIEFQSGANVTTLTVSGCEIRNYTNQIIYNNASATLGTVLFENNLVDRVAGSGGDGFDIRNGSLSNLTIRNSTFSNGIRTFLRNNLATTTSVNVSNCTFYKVCLDNSTNNNGLFLMDKCTTATGSLTVEKCIFSNVGADVVYGYWSKTGKMKAATTYSTNYFDASPYLWDATNGFYKEPTACSATELNPQFTNAENGDFTVGALAIKDFRAGDPRWIK